MRRFDAVDPCTRLTRTIVAGIALSVACVLAMTGRAWAWPGPQTPLVTIPYAHRPPGTLAEPHFQVDQIVFRQSGRGLAGGLTADTPATERLSRVIAHSMAPAFLLGAVAGFVALLMGRMNGIVDRTRAINAIPGHDTARIYLKSDLPRLERRAKLVNTAIYLAVGSAISTTLLLMMAFAAAFFSLHHEPGAAALFLIALALLCAALVSLALEVRIALSEFDHHA